MRIARIALTAGIAAAVSLALGNPAWAVDSGPYPLHQSATTAAGYEGHSCDQVPNGPIAGKDGWVFVLPDNGVTFTKLVLTFKNSANSAVTVTVPTDPATGIVTGNGTSKAYVITPAGWTLTGGQAWTSAALPDKNKQWFNLTHTCPATGTGTPPEQGGGGDTPGGGNRSSSPAAPQGSLPVTGASLTGLIVGGAVLILGGAALLFVRRRRVLFTNR